MRVFIVYSLFHLVHTNKRTLRSVIAVPAGISVPDGIFSKINYRSYRVVIRRKTWEIFLIHYKFCKIIRFFFTFFEKWFAYRVVIREYRVVKWSKINKRTGATITNRRVDGFKVRPARVTPVFKLDMDYRYIVLQQFIPGKLTSDTGSACTRALPLLHTNDSDWNHLIGNKKSCVIMLS